MNTNANNAEVNNQYIINMYQLTSQVDTSLKQMRSIRSMLFNNVKSFEEFCNCRQMLSQVFFEYETSLGMVMKKLNEIVGDVNNMNSELSKSSMINEELDSQLCSASEHVNDLVYQNDLLNSQVNYYKKQLLEKDSFIFYLKEKIAYIENDPMMRTWKENKQNTQNKANNDIASSYTDYNTIVLPERIIRKNKGSIDTTSQQKEPQTISQGPDLGVTLNFSYSPIPQGKLNTINNNVDNKPQFDTLKSFTTIEPVVNKQSDSSVTNPSARTYSGQIGLSKRINNITMNLCRCDPKILTILENKYGKDIFNKISSGNLDPTTVEEIEKDVNLEFDKTIKKSQTIQSETSNYVNDLERSHSLKGWKRLKGYLRLGSENNISRAQSLK